jgi:hypothetical protein
MRSILLGGLMIMAGSAAASDCVAPASTPDTAVAAIAYAPAPSTLAWSAAERVAVSADVVIAREAFERCTRLAQSAGDGYQKRTEFDNTPYRFNMKPGEKLSAEQFDAWMASRGIRIVRAKPAEDQPAATTPAVVGQ